MRFMILFVLLAACEPEDIPHPMSRERIEIQRRRDQYALPVFCDRMLVKGVDCVVCTVDGLYEHGLAMSCNWAAKEGSGS